MRNFVLEATPKIRARRRLKAVTVLMYIVLAGLSSDWVEYRAENVTISGIKIEVENKARSEVKNEV